MERKRIAQVMAWHYKASLGRYFNNPAEILPMVKTMSAGFPGGILGHPGRHAAATLGCPQRTGARYTGC